MNEYLNIYRDKRNFQPKKYLLAKSWMINEYMRKTGISSCTIGVSGGIDSAVTLGILKYASDKKDSPIKKIIALLMPEFVTGTTNQYSSVTRGENLVMELNKKSGTHIESRILDLTNFHNAGIKSVPTSNEITRSVWFLI